MREKDRGQYKLRLPLPIYQSIAQSAKENRRSINAEICLHLEKAFSANQGTRPSQS